MMEDFSSRPLHSFAALSFDVYATLIDWESGIYAAFEPLNSRLSSTHPLKNNKHALLELFARHEGDLLNNHGDMEYTLLLSMVYEKVATELGIRLQNDAMDREKSEFSDTVRHWPCFPDTVEALRVLAKYYRLIILSNIDDKSLANTLAGPLGMIHFDAIYTAQRIGSYKPDLQNFEYLAVHVKKDLGVEKDTILHTAQALEHDHVPANETGISSCWIKRPGSVMGGREEELSDSLSLSFRFDTLEEMAAAVEEAFKQSPQNTLYSGNAAIRKYC